jgi:hypothetical protein
MSSYLGQAGQREIYRRAIQERRSYCRVNEKEHHDRNHFTIFQGREWLRKMRD